MKNGWKHLRSIMVSMLCFSLVFSTFQAVVLAEKANDLEGHWAKGTIEEWMERGDLKGYADGTVKPNNTIKRSEFVTLVNRAFDLEEKSEKLEFKDLKATDWSYDQFAVAVKAGYVQGYSDQTIRPNAVVARQEAAVMIAKVLNVSEESLTQINVFKDFAAIATWSRSSIEALVKNDIMQGYPNLTYKPTGSMTRAEAVVLINNAISNEKSESLVFDKAGVYGPETGVETVAGNVKVTVAGVTLQNMVIKGDLLLAEGVGTGDAITKNVTVEGETIVEGGGANSIHFIDSTLNTLIVDKADGAIRIVAEGTTTIKQTILQSGAKLEENKVTGVGFTEVELSYVLSKDSKIELKGSFDTVDIQAETAVSVKISSGSVANLNVGVDATNTQIEISANVTVKDMVVDAPVKVTGQGKIENATMNEGSRGSSFDKKPTNVTGPQANAIIVTTPSTGSGSTSGGGSNGGGGSTPDPKPETKITSVAKPVWSNTETPNADNVNAFMTQLWEPQTGVFKYADNKLIVNIENITEEMKTFINTNWGGTSVPVKLVFSGSDVVGLTKDVNWSSAYVDWMSLDVKENGLVTRKVGENDKYSYQISYIGGVDVAKEITGIEKPVWSNTDTPNAVNVNAFMDQLWAPQTGVFSSVNNKLTVNIGNITEEMKTFINTNWGGTSIPVKLVMDKLVADGLTPDVNWDNAYVDWMSLDVKENGTVTRKIGTADKYSYTIEYMGGVDVATKITGIEKPVWSNTETPNAANVNAFMDQLWAPQTGVFSSVNNKLTVNIKNITEDMLTFINTNWGGTSVPVKLVMDQSTASGLTPDVNWDNSFVDWMGLNVKDNGTVTRSIGTADKYSYTIEYMGGVEYATEITGIEKPVWSNTETPNAANVNAFMDQLWAPQTGVFSYANKTLTVDISKITEDMLTFINTNWGGTSVPVKLVMDQSAAFGLTPDVNWSNSFVDWMGLDVKDNGTVTRKLGTADKYGYTIEYVGGVEYAKEITAITKPVWSNDATPNAANVRAFMDQLWDAQTGVFSFVNKTLTVDISKITEEMLVFINTNWGGNSVPVELVLDHAVADGLTKDANWSNAYVDWMGLDVTNNGTATRSLGTADKYSYAIEYVGGL